MTNSIAIGSDHAGYDLKERIKTALSSLFTSIEDMGTYSSDSVDYPDFAHPVASAVENKQHPFGILICGSANGVAMTANKHQGIRAAICWKSEIASMARLHNDANILCIPARYLTEEEAFDIVKTFFSTSFEGGRHANRVNKISC